MKFTDLKLKEELLSGLTDINFIEPTPVQEKAIPPVLEGKDMIGTAQTGTGKTGAFVIPIVDRILRGERDGIKAIILTPTRELAQQIDEQIFAIGYHTGITSATVIGGSDFSAQAKALKAGVDIIVATPGRFIDQNKIVNIDFSTVEYLVLDEADRMLDMGFLPDITKIIDWTPKNRQTLLFSATMPKEIEKLAATIMKKDPVSVEIERSRPAQSVEQRAYLLKSHQKIPLVKQIFDTIEWESCIIFTSTKKGTDELQRLLKKKGIKAGSIHGDRSQDERNKALNAFKSGEIPVIVATNVIARGIDIKDISMIINYDVPRSSDDYVHRIGRTGRYDKSGIAVTLITKRDSRSFGEIDKIKGNEIKKIKLPDSFDESTNFYWDKNDAPDRSSGSAENSGSAKKSDNQNKQSKSQDKSRTNGSDSQANGSDSGQKKKAKGSSKKRASSGRQKSQKTNSRTDNSSQGGSGKKTEKRNSRTDKKDSRRNNNGKSGTAASGGNRSGNGKPESSSNAGNSSDNGDRSGRGKSTRPGQKSASREEKRSAPSARTRDRSVSSLPKVEKARERNQNTREPAKGIWGMIKSVIPRLKRD